MYFYSYLPSGIYYSKSKRNDILYDVTWMSVNELIGKNNIIIHDLKMDKNNNLTHIRGIEVNDTIILKNDTEGTLENNKFNMLFDKVTVN